LNPRQFGSLYLLVQKTGLAFDYVVKVSQLSVVKERVAIYSLKLRYLHIHGLNEMVLT
jgi:hypothetical protein